MTDQEDQADIVSGVQELIDRLSQEGVEEGQSIGVEHAESFRVMKLRDD